jgi:formylglycine-generating enzyme required for sulfatase activity
MSGRLKMESAVPVFQAMESGKTRMTSPETPPGESSQPGKIKIHPAWIIVMIGVVILVITAIWRTTPFAELFEHTSTLSATVTSINMPLLFHTPMPRSTSTVILYPTATSLPVEIVDGKGVTMHLVPAGEFTMGSTAIDALAECQKFISNCQQDWFADEEPPQQVYLNNYYMDVFEVTNALYKSCTDTGVCSAPYVSTSYTRSSYYGNPKFDNYPVIWLDWNQANAYCEWRGARLPNEAEWEKAARGTDGRIYPWGEGLDCSRANFRGCKSDTTVVDGYESGKSPYGVYDMAGNVWEWVDGWYGAYLGNTVINSDFGTKYRVMRGGTWYNDIYFTRSSSRAWNDPSYRTYVIGFRCARSAP